MRRLLLLFILCVCGVLCTQAQETISIDNPIAYIGSDHNVYITDGTMTIALTNDAETDEFGPDTVYRTPRWSPDGASLLFIRDAPDGSSVMLTESGSPPYELIGTESGFSVAVPVFAWSPDSTQFAVYAYDGERFGLHVVSIADGGSEYIAWVEPGGIGEGGADDPARTIAFGERGHSPYRGNITLTWTNDGILYYPAENYETVLVSSAGEIVWRRFLFHNPVFSTDFARVAAYIEFDESYLLVNSLTDEDTPIDLSAGARFEAWSGDTLLYSTRETIATVIGDSDMPAGGEVFGDQWNFEAQNNQLALWQYVADGEDRLIFEAIGYDFGMVRIVDDRIFMSMVTSNFDAVTAMNNGADAADIQPLVARAVAYLLNGDDLVLTIEGRQADYNPASFTLFVPE